MFFKALKGAGSIFTSYLQLEKYKLDCGEAVLVANAMRMDMKKTFTGSSFVYATALMKTTLLKPLAPVEYYFTSLATAKQLLGLKARIQIYLFVYYSSLYTS